jgi:mannose-6-phosphate isomerase-like protein (cupin superfamily)
MGSEADGWEQGLRPYLSYRDLGLAAATDGKLGALRVRSKEEVASDWHCHDLDFQFFYVLRGSISLETETGQKVTLGPGDTGYQPGLLRHRETISVGYECVEITGPAEGDTITGKDAPLPARAAHLDPDRDSHFSRDSGEPYRDLGLRDRTAGRLHIYVTHGAAASRLVLSTPDGEYLKFPFSLTLP